MNPISCAHAEPLLTEYIEGALPASDLRRLEEHLASCPSCTSAIEDMRLAFRWTQGAEDLPIPANLVARILEQTTKPSESALARWWHQLVGWAGPVLEPRFAMGSAMAVISLSLLLKFAGFDVRTVQAADLRPSNLLYSLDSKVHLAGSHVAKYYRDLRVVYEIQSQLQALREDDSVPARTTPATKEEKKKEAPPSEPQRKQLNRKWSRELSVMAMAILP
jgi:hypothetical protein